MINSWYDFFHSVYEWKNTKEATKIYKKKYSSISILIIIIKNRKIINWTTKIKKKETNSSKIVCIKWLVENFSVWDESKNSSNIQIIH